MSTQNKTLHRILSELKPYRVWVIWSLLFAFFNVLFTLLLPVYIGKAVDTMIGPEEILWDELVRIVLIMAIFILSAAVCQWGMNRVNNHITYHFTRDLRRRAFQKLQIMPISGIDTHARGDYMSRISTDADVLCDGLLLGFNQLFSGVLTIVGTILFMMRINVWIALVVVALTPLSLLVARFVSKRSFLMFQTQAEVRGEQLSFSDEMLEHAEVVSAFSYETKAKEKFAEQNERLADASLKATFFSSLTNPATRFVNSIIYAGVGAAGALIAISGGITIGGLTSFLSYASSYAKPFNEISGIITEMQNALACGTRLFELIDEEPAADCAKELGDVSGKITFSDVSFSYTPSRPLIEHLSLDVLPGQHIAIVGPTGSGKTTLINLIMRFYDVNDGAIAVDGIDIRDVSRTSLRAQIGMVLQETWLFDGTIRQNLLFANENATEEEMIAAAKRAHAHSLIKRLPNGYDTRITADDDHLSQGEKQLLCIARLMLSLPPILILDEATSSIDTRTEQKIQSAFQMMMHGRKTFVVAHRLSPIKDADVILYMEDGHVLEQGSHEELIRRGGYYAALYEKQFGGNS